MNIFLFRRSTTKILYKFSNGFKTDFYTNLNFTQLLNKENVLYFHTFNQYNTTTYILNKAHNS